MNPTGEYSRRKSLLIAKADLERLKLRHALGEIENTLRPPATTPAKWVAPTANTILALAMPALGLQKIRHLVQMLSTGVLIYRIVNQWRQGQ